MNNWVPTFTGKRFDPSDPQPSQVCLEDLAHHLAHQCRYAGGTIRHYSTAEHCVRMARVGEKRLKTGLLLHDGPEAYISDVVSPVKNLDMMTPYRFMDDRLTDFIFKKYGVPYRVGSPEWYEVKDIDYAMVILEAGMVLPHPDNLSGSLKLGDQYGELACKMAVILQEGVKFRHWGWEAKFAETVFLETAESLGLHD